MIDRNRKPMLTPLEAASDAGFEEACEHRLPKPRVVGSNPIARSSCDAEYVRRPSFGGPFLLMVANVRDEKGCARGLTSFRDFGRQLVAPSSRRFPWIFWFVWPESHHSQSQRNLQRYCDSGKGPVERPQCCAR